MIILDTNIVSEFIGTPPKPSIIAWFDTRQKSELYLTSINLAETLAGLERLPHGARRTRFERQFMQFRMEIIGPRMLDFDTRAAVAFASVTRERLEKGKHVDMADMQIAAIARVYNCAIATRNTKDFDGLDLNLINPFGDLR